MSEGIEVLVDGEEVWLTFNASDGKSAMVSVAALADRMRGPISKAAIEQWIEDRKTENSTKATPAPTREFG